MQDWLSTQVLLFDTELQVARLQWVAMSIYDAMKTGFFVFVFLTIQGFELRTLSLLGKYSATALIDLVYF
jgi:hypothetical protein